MKKIEGVSKMSKYKLATKGMQNEVAITRKSVQCVCRNLPALLQTLHWYKNKDFNATVTGLLKKMKKPNFIGILYILKHVLPILSMLIKVFQKCTISFSRISPAIRKSKNVLEKLVQDKTPVKEFRKETTTCNLFCPELTENDAEETETKMQDVCCEYVSALTENFDNRFQHSLPVVESLRIFDPVSIPPEEGAPTYPEIYPN